MLILTFITFYITGCSKLFNSFFNLHIKHKKIIKKRYLHYSKSFIWNINSDFQIVSI